MKKMKMKKKTKKRLLKYAMAMAQQFEQQNRMIYNNLEKLNQALAEVCEHVGLEANRDPRILRSTRQKQASYNKPPVDPNAH